MDASADFKDLGVQVQSIEADLATDQGVTQVLDAVGNRPVDVLIANAGHGLGGAFVEQDPKGSRHTIDTNVTGTLLLIQPVLQDMLKRGEGKILVTGSIAGYVPGSFNAVYNGTKAFIDNFCAAISDEIKGSNVTLTVLKPGATETEFFRRADMLDTKVGQQTKDDAADVAETGWKALHDGKRSVVHGLMNKATVLAAGVTPESVTASRHRSQAEPIGALFRKP